MTELTLGQRISECGRAVATATLPAMANSGNVHMQTMIAAVARMAGVYMFRSFGLKPDHVQPGQVILVEQAGPSAVMLIQICANVLKELGSVTDAEPPLPLSDPQYAAQLDFLATQGILEPVLNLAQVQYALDNRQMAQATAIGTALLVHALREHLNPQLGFGVACLAMTEGCRTLPAAL
jgi:hypothetical protein